MANIVRRGSGEQAPMRREGGYGGAISPFRMMEDLLGWDPFRTMAPLLAQREGGIEPGFVPSFEVKETKDNYVFKADLPGVREEDLDISLTGNTLTVSGKRESEEREQGETWYTYERSYGSFSRTFTLPEGANADKATADLRDGVLTLSVPKRPEAQPKRISVQAKGAGEGGPDKDKDKDKAKGILGKDKGEPAKA